MKDPKLIKRLSVAHGHLRSAANYISSGVVSNVPAAHVPLAEVESTLSESALIDCLNTLASVGDGENPRAGFWRDLERAAETLGLTELSAAHHARFLVSLGLK